jgi:pimeloyl-ACP methyl ester carboxylesterase
VRPGSRRLRTLVLAVGAAVLTSLALCGSAIARDHVIWMDGAHPRGTPDEFNQVGVLKYGPSSARNVLVLVPGTSAGAGYLAPLARTVVHRLDGWQIWAVERRENLIEDQSMLNKVKRGDATPRRFFNYYLGWLTNDNIENHFRLVPESQVGFARRWGMRVEVNDLRHVVKAATRQGGDVVLGGHSLGGSITTAYATWDFQGGAGVEDLSGLVYIDGGSGADSPTPAQARKSLHDLQNSSPWLAFGGIASPFLGLFSAVGSTLAVVAPDSPAELEGFALLPLELVPPVPVTNEGGFGYAVDAGTSPNSLRAAQVNAGHLAASGDPRTWVRDGAITPIQRYAAMLAGTRLTNVDGSAWYHPMRLTIDSNAVAAGNANPAQDVLNVRAIHGDEIDVPIYAFGAALGGERVLDAARLLAQQSGLPARELTLINRERTYTHNDPNSANPKNVLVDNLVPFLRRVAGG